MELKDFSTKPSMSLSDFTSFINSAIDLSQQTVNDIAAASAISKGQSEEEFRSTRQSLTTQEGRKSWIQNWIAESRLVYNNASQELGNIVVDPLLSNGQKGELLSSVANLNPSFTMNHSELMAYQAAQAEPTSIQSEAQFLTQQDTIDLVKNVVDSKTRLQKAFNAEAIRRDSGALNTAKDIAELMIPFAEQAFFTGLANDQGQGTRLLMGEQKKRLFDLFNSMPVDKREKTVNYLLDLLKNNSSVVLPGTNDLLALDALESLSGAKDYSNVRRYFDDFITIMDATGVLSLVGKFAGVGRFAAELPTAATRASVKGSARPSSVQSILRDVNPEAADMNAAAALADPTDTTAQTLYGVSRADAAADTILPDPTADINAIKYKPSSDGVTQFAEDPAARSARNAAGNEVTLDESIGVIDRTEQDLANISGFKLAMPEMSIVNNADGSVGFLPLYHPLNRGWRSAKTAVKDALLAFRRFGATEKDINLYARTAEGWVKTTQEELAARAVLREGITKAHKAIPDNLKELDYAVGFKYNMSISPSDIEAGTFQTFTVRGSLFKWLFPGWGKSEGSILEHAMPIDSTFDAAITLPLNAATDTEVALRKVYVDMIDPFKKAYNSMKENRRLAIRDYIFEANEKGLPFNVVDLAKRGFNAKERDLLRQWRVVNDTLWRATNKDLAVSMRNKGFQFLVDESGTNLAAKPMKRGAVSSKTVIHDLNGDVVTMEKAEVDALYESGGSIARLPQPIKINDTWVSNIKVTNTTKGGYLRRINNSDILLPYRKGYYPVMYDANFFITKSVKTPEGIRDVTIASAKTREEALAYQTNLIETNVDNVPNPSEYYSIRGDVKRPQEGVFQGSDHPWNLLTSSGTSAQRVRGQRLVNAADPSNLRPGSNLVDPLEAISNQMSQLARKIAVRPWLDTTKSRWIDNYGKYLDLPTNNRGSIDFPSDIKNVVGKSGTPQKVVVDAKAMWNYIHHQENGFKNLIDDTTKAMFNMGADMLVGTKGAALEGPLRAASRSSPTRKLKGIAFRVLLAANPTRQILVQGHQTIQLIPIYPKYLLKGGLMQDLYEINKVRYGLSTDPKYVQMYNELKRSGMMQAVDANNLVRQDELNLASFTNWDKFIRTAKTPVDLLQKAGFDKGEQMVLITAWLAERDKVANTVGRALTRREYVNIAGKARAFTYSMNRAGDFPYQTNSLNLLAQFTQVAHKAFLQPFTSRTLTTEQKARLLLWNGVVYGPPAGIVAGLVPNRWFDGATPGDPTFSKKVLENGLEDTLLNMGLTELSKSLGGTPVNIDWGDLAPGKLTGMNDMIVALALNGDLAEAIKNAPSFSLFFGQNPRFTQAFKTAANYFSPGTDYNDPKLQTTFMDVVNDSMKIYSGYSNMFKTIYAVRTRQKLSSYGTITDSNVNYPEALAQFFGFRTREEVDIFLSKDVLYGSKEFRRQLPKDMERWYNDVKRHLASRGQTTQGSSDLTSRVLAEAWLVFDKEPQAARRALFNLIRKDALRGNMDFVQGIKKQMGIMDESTIREIISRLPSGPDRDALIFDLNQVYGKD